MKKVLLLLILILNFIPVCIVAQQYPPEWVKYTYGGYIYDFKSDYNSKNISEIQFANNLLNIARAGLAKQIEVRVKDNTAINKIAVNGKTTITYISVSDFSTDVNIKLLGTKVKYDPAAKRGFAIAYIEKEAARRYYKNELNTFFNKISNALTNADNYVATGFKSRAKTELESVLSEFGTIDESFFWLAIFDLPQYELNQLLTRRYTLEQSVKQTLADLQYATSICLVCTVDIFGTSYNSFQNELKGELDGCNFTDDPTRADWNISIKASSREYGYEESFYFAYVDADITIYKVITSQRICEDRISVKGGHPSGYKEAALAAYKDLSKQLNSLIIKKIKQ